MSTLGDIVMFIAPFVVILVAPVAAIYPGWKRENAARPGGIAVLILPLSGIALWVVVFFAVALMNVKGGSLTNLLLETSVVAWAAVVIAYVRFRTLGPGSRFEARRDALTFGALLCAVVIVRSFVPEMGE